MNDAWTWTTAWGLTVGVGGWAEKGRGRKTRTTVIEQQ